MKVELQCGDTIAIPEGCKAIVKDGSDGVCRQRTFEDKEIEILDTTPPIDWEQRRYEIAKDAMNGCLCSPVIAGVNPNPNFKDVATFSVRLADALIKELKGGKE